MGLNTNCSGNYPLSSKIGRWYVVLDGVADGTHEESKPGITLDPIEAVHVSCRCVKEVEDL